MWLVTRVTKSKSAKIVRSEFTFGCLQALEIESSLAFAYPMANPRSRRPQTLLYRALVARFEDER